MFCAKNRQRDGEAQMGQSYDLIGAASMGDIVLRGQQPNRQQRDAGGGHRPGSARECQECGENSYLPNRYNLKFYDRVGG